MALLLPFATPTGYGLGKSGWVSARFAPSDDPPLGDAARVDRRELPGGRAQEAGREASGRDHRRNASSHWLLELGAEAVRRSSRSTARVGDRGQPADAAVVVSNLKVLPLIDASIDADHRWRGPPMTSSRLWLVCDRISAVVTCAAATSAKCSTDARRSTAPLRSESTSTAQRYSRKFGRNVRLIERQLAGDLFDLQRPPQHVARPPEVAATMCANFGQPDSPRHPAAAAAQHAQRDGSVSGRACVSAERMRARQARRARRRAPRGIGRWVARPGRPAGRQRAGRAVRPAASRFVPAAPRGPKAITDGKHWGCGPTPPNSQQFESRGSELGDDRYLTLRGPHAGVAPRELVTPQLRRVTRAGGAQPT